MSIPMRMQQRRGTAAQWAASGVILSEGEIGYDRTNKNFRVGDGVSSWASLPVSGVGPDVIADLGTSDGQVKALLTTPGTQTEQVFTAKIEGASRPIVVNNRAALRAWDVALANRDNQRVTIYGEGDSFFESSASVGSRVLDMLHRRLMLRYPLLGSTLEWIGPNYLPPRYAITPSGGSDPTTTTGSAGAFAGSSAPGLRNMTLTAAGTRTWTLDGKATSARLYYSKSTATAGSFTVHADGVLVATINVVDLTGTPDGNIVPITFTGTATHTVTVTWVSGTVRFGGLEMFYGNESRGFHIIEAGHSGFKASDFISPSRPGAPSVQASNADLYILQLGANDKVTETPTQYADNIAARLAQVRAVRTSAMSYLVLIPYQADGTTTLAGYTWDDYRTALRAVLRVDPLTAWIDVAAIMPATNSAEGIASGLYNADKIHPVAKGAARLEQIIATALDPVA